MSFGSRSNPARLSIALFLVLVTVVPLTRQCQRAAREPDELAIQLTESRPGARGLPAGPHLTYLTLRSGDSVEALEALPRSAAAQARWRGRLAILKISTSVETSGFVTHLQAPPFLVYGDADLVSLAAARLGVETADGVME